MMKENNYHKALTEVYIIIEHLSKDLKAKIPDRFIKFVIANKDENYVFKFNKNEPIQNQKLLEETKVLLTVVYREFLCSQEEKEELNKKLLENERIFQKENEKKYSIENLFSNKRSNKLEATLKEDTKQIVKYKESLLKKILRKITSIFS